MLERLGYQTDVAKDGAQALGAIVRGSYDLVLMDMHMPNMDGLEATRRIRTNTAVMSQPTIIGLTADVLGDARQQALAAGMDGYVAKPVQAMQLTEVLRACPKRQTRP